MFIWLPAEVWIYLFQMKIAYRHFHIFKAKITELKLNWCCFTYCIIRWKPEKEQELRTIHNPSSFRRIQLYFDILLFRFFYTICRHQKKVKLQWKFIILNRSYTCAGGQFSSVMLVVRYQEATTVYIYIDWALPTICGKLWSSLNEIIFLYFTIPLGYIYKDVYIGLPEALIISWN